MMDAFVAELGDAEQLHNFPYLRRCWKFIASLERGTAIH